MKNLLMPQSKYRIESYEPSPGQKRTENMSNFLQAIGGFTDRNNIPFLSSFADERNAYRMANKLNNAYETVGDFIPGLSYELAKEREDDLGQNLAMLDLIPGGAIPKQVVKKTIKDADEVKDMMFLHNTSSEALENYQNLGGLPSPSMAVTQKDLPFEGFGDITLVGKPGNFDPKVSASNKIYSSDAYTPRAPAPIQTTKRNAYDYLLENYEPLAKKFDEGIGFILDDVYQQSFKKHASSRRQNQVKEIFNSLAGKLKFLEDQGINLNPIMKSTDLRIKKYKSSIGNKNMIGIFNKLTGKKIEGVPEGISDGSFLVPYGQSGTEYIQNLYKEMSKPTIDKIKTRTLINSAIDKFKVSDFNAWKKAEMEKIFNPEKFFESTNPYAYNPNPKFKEYELNNLVNYMKKQRQIGGEQGMGSKGVGRLKSVLTGKFKNLDEVKKNKSQLVDKELAENKELYEKTQNDFFEISEDLWEGSDKAINQFSFIDTVNDQIFEAIQRGGSKEAIRKSFDFLGDLPNAQVNKIEKFIKDLEKAPVEYFEAKPTRAVGLDEFAGAIVPTYTKPETLQLLKNLGLRREFYDPRYPRTRIQAREKFNKEMFAYPLGILGGGSLFFNAQDQNNNTDI